MKLLITPYFLIHWVAYCISLLSKFKYLPQSIWASVVADYSCLPILLSFSLVVLRKVKRLPNFILPISMIIFTWLYVSVVFEFILPHFKPRYTQDYWDILLYAIGGVSYYLNQKFHTMKEGT